METSDLNSYKQPAPWVPMTNPGDLATLNKTIEELGELISIASRCLNQGIDEPNPETGKLNRVALEDEIADVMAGCLMIINRFRLDVGHITMRQDKKQAFKRRWIEMLDERFPKEA